MKMLFPRGMHCTPMGLSKYFLSKTQDGKDLSSYKLSQSFEKNQQNAKNISETKGQNLLKTMI